MTSTVNDKRRNKRHWECYCSDQHKNGDKDSTNEYGCGEHNKENGSCVLDDKFEKWRSKFQQVDLKIYENGTSVATRTCISKKALEIRTHKILKKIKRFVICSNKINKGTVYTQRSAELQSESTLL